MALSCRTTFFGFKVLRRFSQSEKLNDYRTYLNLAPTLESFYADQILLVVLCREKEWVLDDNVTYVKCMGGPTGREGILVACRDGQVFKFYVNNAFPCLLWKHRRAIRYTDLSVLSNSLALIDDEACLSVVSLKQGNVRSPSRYEIMSLLRGYLGHNFSLLAVCSCILNKLRLSSISLPLY